MSKAAQISILLCLIPGFLAIDAGKFSESSASDSSRGLPPQAPPVTFTKHIAPILFKHCAVCHHPGGEGPFSLLSFEDAKKHARQIAVVTQTRFMPPWLPEPGYGEFVGERERRLSKAEVETIQQWVRQGAPEGSPRDLPPQPHFVEGWQLGKPGLVLKMPRAFILQAAGRDVYRNFVFPVPIKTTRFVKAWEILPGNKKVIHHCNVLIDRTGTARRREGEGGEPGFGGMDVEITSERFEPQSHFIFWKPGSVPSVEPAGMAWRVDPGSDLVLNTHMHPSGKLEAVQPEIGLYFTVQPENKFPMLLELENDAALDIPAGEKDFVVSDKFELPLDCDLLAVYPHAHYLGRDIQAVATLPDGTKQWLIWIKDWNTNWQAVYRYVRPIFLPQGTTVTMRYSYDNSSGNVRNPSNPPRRVVGGNESTDEMAHLWVQVLPRQARVNGLDARMILQEALMRHDLEKYPDNFVANYNLAAVLHAEGRLDGAIQYYQRALQLRPGDATAQNSLGAALQSQGKLDQAIIHYRLALAAKPDYLDAHHNLGNSLLLQGEFDESIKHFREVLRIRPKEAEARNKLGEALEAQGNSLALQGRLDEAISYFREVLQIKPDDADTYNNLGSAYARKGNLVQAAAYFKLALGINPQHAVAIKNLKHVQALLEKEQATTR